MASHDLKTSHFDYDLPREMIAQFPAEKRGESRLLVYHGKTGRIEHRTFGDVVEYLRGGDVLVLNNTKVVPARLMGRKSRTGGRVELLILREMDAGRCEALCKPGSRLRPGTELEFPGGARAEIESTCGGTYIINFFDGKILNLLIEESGLAPLPPYIARKREDAVQLREFDLERYQTIYAKERGAVAAPTAGLHFSGEILKDLRKKGVELAEVTLHVGVGTFRPVTSEFVEDHAMEEESYEIQAAAAETITRARAAGRSVLVVGTTTVRALESAAREDGTIGEKKGETSLFIYPPYDFKVAENLLTNFHLPGSTLIMMLAALLGREKILELYEEAKREGYRFYSYGDAMLLLND